MISILPLVRRMDPSGTAWPGNGNSNVQTVGDIFGHRTFAAHASGIDFHRGMDVDDGLVSTPVYSMINGCIIRRFYGMTYFDNADNINQFAIANPAVVSMVQNSGYATLTGVNAGTVTYPTGCGRAYWQYEPMSPSAGDWYIDIKFNAAFSSTGAWIVGMYNAALDQYACLNYDGTTMTVRGKDAAGVMTADGTTASPAFQSWIRIKQVGTTVSWQYSTDGSTFTTITTETSVAWGATPFQVFMGFDPAAAGANDTLQVEFFGFFDGNSIGRFGNWVEVGTANEKITLQHFADIDVQIGAVVTSGQLLGWTGKTGFDINSGRILQYHCHFEYIPNNRYIYDNDDPINPLAILPRPNDTVSIAVVRTEENDPLGNASHKLNIQVQRGSYGNFQINLFTLTGNTATRTLNWDTRAGLDPADNDAVQYDGIYFEPLAFNEASTEYEYNLYFHKSVVGATFVSAEVQDIDGNVLWSDP